MEKCEHVGVGAFELKSPTHTQERSTRWRSMAAATSRYCTSAGALFAHKNRVRVRPPPPPLTKGHQQRGQHRAIEVVARHLQPLPHRQTEAEAADHHDATHKGVDPPCGRAEQGQRAAFAPRRAGVHEAVEEGRDGEARGEDRVRDAAEEEDGEEEGGDGGGDDDARLLDGVGPPRARQAVAVKAALACG